MSNLMLTLSLFASAGGGGSDSGGGELAIMVLAGWAPMQAIGAIFRRKYFKHKDDDKFVIGQAITWVTASVYAVIWLIIGIVFAISGSFFGFIFFGIEPAVGALLGAGAGLYGWFGKIKQSKAAKAALQQAAQADNAWSEESLRTTAQNIFTAFQRDWSNFDLAKTQSYLTPRYYGHISLMLTALQQMGRRNATTITGFNETQIVSVVDSPDDSQDSFVVGIEATADDQLIDTRANQILFTDKRPITEFWRFNRDGQAWRLDGIQPATAAEWTRNAALENFAASNGVYYSLDWGWLLLPQRGQLFAGGTFGKSDINNHCIGWTETVHDKILTQIYTYTVNPMQYANAYLIAQATLPRDYGDIVVRRKKGLFQFKIKGLKEVSTEWNDFNKMYQVFATSPEQATSLELLNPKYMEQLAAVPFEINIEVIDNVVYLYAPISGLKTRKADEAAHQSQDMANKYQTVLQLLQAAFKEMKM
jgi:hypothetical protein